MKKIGIILATALALAACGTDSESQLLDDRTVTSVQPVTLKMYDERQPQINPECDLYTELQLINGYAGAIAKIENKLGGSCKIAVAPNAMTLNLVETEMGCGSKAYEAIIPEGLNRITRVEVIDHRSRLCMDLVVNQVELRIHRGESVTNLYAFNAPVIDTKKVGVFTQIAGIGGESTGYGLMLEDGSFVEVDLHTHGLTHLFVEEGNFVVKGYMQTFRGVETVRRVLIAVEVESI